MTSIDKGQAAIAAPNEPSNSEKSEIPLNGSAAAIAETFIGKGENVPKLHHGSEKIEPLNGGAIAIAEASIERGLAATSKERFDSEMEGSVNGGVVVLAEPVSTNGEVHHTNSRTTDGVLQAPSDPVSEVVAEERQELKLPGEHTKSTVHEEQRERVMRRRKVKRLLRPGVIPSFVALISPEGDDSSRTSTPKEPVQIRVDVDEYLGLKHVPKPDAIKSHANADLSEGSSLNQVALPVDEGWYEGVIPVSLPDEKRYLNELHCVIRSNLEFFSAKASDVNMTQAGRRTPVVLGKVGIRCIHCARVASGQESSSNSRTSNIGLNKPSHKLWPAGSISFPKDIAALYPVISQKPALHFETCPNLPLPVKSEFFRVSSDTNGSHKRQRKHDGSFESMSAVMYYEVAAKRLGVVESKAGLRFSRDLSLEPLSMEAARAQVEMKRVNSRKTVLGASPLKSTTATMSVPVINADPDSEMVLAEAVAERDGVNDDLVKPGDRALVSDFMFLCIKQMAICNAVQADFNSRGKKPKLMKIGFAGFCCRHCSHIPSTGFVQNNIDFSCRSFASAPDNLASAISNSFYTHLQKCFLVPDRLKKALTSYKRLHSRQLGRLPYGAQRRLFHLMWARLRAADRSVAEMEENPQTKPGYEAVPTGLEQASAEPLVGAQSLGVTSPRVFDADTANDLPQEVSSAGLPDIVPSAAHWEAPGTFTGRPVSFPLCESEETQRLLKAAEEERDDPSVVDTLFLPSDRNLVTDFVFLIMKQLRVAHPNSLDFARGRRSTMLNSAQAGLCCKYCMHQEQFGGASGRSFPSQPDNLASTLNTSLHQHMQRCQFVPDDLKRALANLKKLHSSQLSHLRFGSQRRFFNLLFARLSKVEVQEIDVTDQLKTEGQPSKDFVDDETLGSFGFIRSASGCFTCQRCRMVPIELRGAGSITFERPTEQSLRDHGEACKGDSFDLTIAASSLEAILQSCSSMKIDLVIHPAFKAVIRELVGGNEQLVHEFTEEVMKKFQHMKNGDSSNVTTLIESTTSRGLWCKFPSRVDVEKVAEAFGAFVQKVIPTVSPRLEENPGFVRYFQVVSPSFLIPEKEEQQTENPASNLG